MSLRYANFFKFFRYILKSFFCFIYPFIIKIWPLPKVLSIEETLNKIISEKCSIARFGDGEFLYIIDRLNLPFQKQDSELREKLIKILKSDEQKILIGLPIGYHSMKNLTKSSKLTWRSQIAWIYPRLRKYLDLNRTYYNSSITRPYIAFKNKTHSQNYFEKLMKIWEDRNVLIIEGEKSRLGVGNDLFSKAKNVERILAPMHHAFSKYTELLHEALKHDKSKLILIALGPTATALAFDLAKHGYQAIDIGNVDIEYEWFLRGATDKIKIPGKYASEAKGGRHVEDIHNEEYNSQIIKKIL